MVIFAAQCFFPESGAEGPDLVVRGSRFLRPWNLGFSGPTWGFVRRHTGPSPQFPLFPSRPKIGTSRIGPPDRSSNVWFFVVFFQWFPRFSMCPVLDVGLRASGVPWGRILKSREAQNGFPGDPKD